jgi:predicted phage tail protein
VRPRDETGETHRDRCLVAPRQQYISHRRRLAAAYAAGLALGATAATAAVTADGGAAALLACVALAAMFTDLGAAALLAGVPLAAMLAD